MGWMSRPLAMTAGVLILSIVGVAACNDASTGPDDDRIFIVEVEGERFNMRATNAEAIAKLEERRREGEIGVISGKLMAGDGGFNAPWSWHLDPATVHVPDLTIELCDGRPSMVEADLEYWLNQVESFCPWSARVVESRQ